MEGVGRSRMLGMVSLSLKVADITTAASTSDLRIAIGTGLWWYVPAMFEYEVLMSMLTHPLVPSFSPATCMYCRRARSCAFT